MIQYMIFRGHVLRVTYGNKNRYYRNYGLIIVIKLDFSTNFHSDLLFFLSFFSLKGTAIKFFPSTTRHYYIQNIQISNQKQAINYFQTWSVFLPVPFSCAAEGMFDFLPLLAFVCITVHIVPTMTGKHPIHVHPARPFYRFAATALGASMWFFVSKPLL